MYLLIISISLLLLFLYFSLLYIYNNDLDNMDTYMDLNSLGYYLFNYD